MWALFWAVTEELATFAYTSVRGWFVVTISDGEHKRLPSPLPHTALPLATTQDEAVGGAHAVPRALSYTVTTALAKPTSTALTSPIEINQNKHHPRIQKGTVVYIAALAVPLRESAGESSMGTAVVSYGSMVMVMEVRDTWACVAHGAETGWVAFDELEDCAANVYPSFHIGDENGADAVTTTRTRAMIQDEFGAGEARLPLQAEEFVMYRLLRKGKRIAWPSVRPRTPGSWFALLKDEPRITKLADPVAGCVVEFVHHFEDGRGHLAYIEAVFPDHSIQISEVNWPDRGIFNERVLVEEEWRKLDPVFLLVV